MIAALQAHGSLLVGIVMFLIGLMAGSALDLTARKPLDAGSARLTAPGCRSESASAPTTTHNRLVSENRLDSMTSPCDWHRAGDAVAVCAGGGRGMVGSPCRRADLAHVSCMHQVGGCQSLPKNERLGS